MQFLTDYSTDRQITNFKINLFHKHGILFNQNL
ncbi:hypothetical protein T12_10246 [Trichinella patagoniensis]|uniref:Uncharacterized protein n=1 Tax=Trichinella patagoniensis TaxID=990121 RepID=A0A0V0Z0X9_9BILA|nr:hypothetical protein T12_13145 [Trichinella patagoniensis]KRY06060.1 hypothetical protein T12_10246 [Trichinella patagoniensis]